MKKIYLKTYFIITTGFALFTVFFLVTGIIEGQSIQAHSNQKNIINFREIREILGTDKLTFQNLNAEETERQINFFFSYLDQQPYIKEYKFIGGTRDQFNHIIDSIAAVPPIVPRETDSIYYVLKNYFYFYRILGKQRIEVIKQVLTNEPDQIEPLMYCFYVRFKEKNKITAAYDLNLSLEQAYIYACFFLETIGGRNYLFRRNPKVRELISYYCILMIDQANNAGLNSNGVDIRPHIKLSLKNMALQANIAFKKRYLNELEKLRKKYNIS
jgi:hypothetical protein